MDSPCYKCVKKSIIASTLVCIFISVGSFCYYVYILEATREPYKDESDKIFKENIRRHAICLVIISIISFVMEVMGLIATVREHLILCTAYATVLAIGFLLKLYFRTGYLASVSVFITTVLVLSLIYMMLKYKD